MGGSWELPVMGIAAGYIVHYLDVIYPAQHGGNRLIPTPSFLKDWFPPPTSGGIHAGPQDSARPTTRAAWGSGQRLGAQ
jgi:hypothetical protein